MSRLYPRVVKHDLTIQTPSEFGVNAYTWNEIPVSSGQIAKITSMRIKTEDLNAKGATVGIQKVVFAFGAPDKPIDVIAFRSQDGVVGGPILYTPGSEYEEGQEPRIVGDFKGITFSDNTKLYVGYKNTTDIANTEPIEIQVVIQEGV